MQPDVFSVKEREILDAVVRLGNNATDRAVHEELGFRTAGFPLAATISGMIARKLLMVGPHVECPVDKMPSRTLLAPQHEIPAGRMASFTELYRGWAGCQRCALSSSRERVCFGRGNLNASVVVIGATPGRAENISGMPFNGTASRILDKFMASVGLQMGTRGDVFGMNLVCCRAADDAASDTRLPRTAEVTACLPHVEALLRIIRPRVVVMLGSAVSDVLFAQGKLLRFPQFVQGVAFFRVTDPDECNVADDDTRKVRTAAAKAEWRAVEREWQRTAAVPAAPVVWRLPIVVRL